MSTVFSVSGQHYLFDVQAFAQTVLAQGGENYSYALRDRTTRGVIEDVASGASEIGVLVKTSVTAAGLEAAFDEAGLEFTQLCESAPRVALPSSHPLINAKSLTLDQLEDWPYLYFDQGDEESTVFAEEALADVPRAKTIACTDRASLSELIVALNGYTITSGILVGISDGSALTTLPLETDITLHLGIVTRKGQTLSDLGKRFVDRLAKSLERYSCF